MRSTRERVYGRKEEGGKDDEQDGRPTRNWTSLNTIGACLDKRSKRLKNFTKTAKENGKTWWNATSPEEHTRQGHLGAVTLTCVGSVAPRLVIALGLLFEESAAVADSCIIGESHSIMSSRYGKEDNDMRFYRVGLVLQGPCENFFTALRLATNLCDESEFLKGWDKRGCSQGSPARVEGSETVSKATRSLGGAWEMLSMQKWGRLGQCSTRLRNISTFVQNNSELTLNMGNVGATRNLCPYKGGQQHVERRSKSRRGVARTPRNAEEDLGMQIEGGE